VLTHHRDFAVGLCGLLGNSKALGEAFHITSDEVLTWNEIYTTVARAAGCQPQLVHVPSSQIAKEHPDWGAGLLGDKAHSVVFDNAKIRRFVPEYSPRIPFFQGAREIVDFYAQHPHFEALRPDVDALMDRLIARFG
jgi:nucleoside-diphosphate-sugar epimerase